MDGTVRAVMAAAPEVVRLSGTGSCRHAADFLSRHFRNKKNPHNLGPSVLGPRDMKLTVSNTGSGTDRSVISLAGAQSV